MTDLSLKEKNNYEDLPFSMTIGQIIGNKYHVSTVSDGMCKTLSASRNEIMHNFYDFIHPKDIFNFDNCLANIEEKSEQRIIVRLRIDNIYHNFICIINSKESGDAVLVFVNYFDLNSSMHIPHKHAIKPEKGPSEDYLIHSIKSLLEDELINIYYQPIFDTFSNKISSLEVSAKIVDPIYGTLNKKDYAKVFEKNHLNFLIDIYVLEHVCQDFDKRRENGDVVVPLIISLDIYDFSNEDIMSLINTTLQKYQVPHEFVNFKLSGLTDSDDQKVICKISQKLKENNYHVWLSNNLSLFDIIQKSNFAGFMIDIRRLDQTKKSCRIIVSQLVDFSKRLDMSCLIYGIESEDQVSFLKDLGATMIQGDFLMPPVTKDELIKGCQEKGYKLENEDERHLYDQIDQVNVLDSTSNYFGKMVQSISPKVPLAIFTLINDHIRFVYKNDSCNEWIKNKLHTNSAVLGERISAKTDVTYAPIWDAINTLQSIGEIAECVLALSNYSCRLRIQLIGTENRMKAFLLHLGSYSLIDQKDLELEGQVYGYVHSSEIDQQAIWSSMMYTGAIPVYWKDKNRRFLGANRSFLTFYGLKLSDILGKTDDELNFNVEKKNFNDNEIDVLTKGISVQGQIGTTMVGRKYLRKIKAYKSPIYIDKEIVGLVGCFIDVTEQEKRIDTLENEASFDSLTDLKNRRRLQSEFSYLSGQKLLVMMIDIDNFKDFNDKFGHKYGDEVLHKFGQEILTHFGVGNCYRYGGDEFLVIRDYTSQEDIMSCYREIRDHMENAKILELQLPVTFSAGYVTGTPKDSDEIKQMIYQADSYLYKSKKHGRSQIHGAKFKN